MKGPIQTVYGLHAVRAILTRQPDRVQLVRIAEKRDDPRVKVIQDLARDHGKTVQRVDARSLQQMLGEVAHQGVAADIQPLPPWSEDDLLTALETARDPLLL